MPCIFYTPFFIKEFFITKRGGITNSIYKDSFFFSQVISPRSMGANEVRDDFSENGPPLSIKIIIQEPGRNSRFDFSFPVAYNPDT
jgi:hypothetical protein